GLPGPAPEHSPGSQRGQGSRRRFRTGGREDGTIMIAEGAPVPAPAAPEVGTTPLLEFRDVHVAYGAIQALRGVNYRVNAGEIVCLLGANGAGKTTTMKTIIGLVRPFRDKVLFK